MTGLKTTYLAFAALLAASVLSAQSSGNKPYTGSIEITPLTMQQRGDSLYVTIRYNIDSVKTLSRRSIELTPLLVREGNMKELPQIAVRGRANYLISRRRVALMSDRELADCTERPYAVVKGFGQKAHTTGEYSIAVLFEPWMSDASICVREEVSGCGASTMLSVSPSFSRMKPYRMVCHISYLQPQVEPVKRRQIESEVLLDFAVSKTDIRPGYMHNAAELEKIRNILKDIEDTLSVTVRSISVAGYASPEGSQELNRRLSEGRARALIEYLRPHLNFPESMYRIIYGGENWKGLREMVAQSGMEDKAEILDIIDNIPEEINYSTNTSRKKSLMSYKGGDPYRYLLREYFPHLRKAVCRIDYEEQSFDVQQAKAVINTRPEDLSLNEMYHVALTCEPGSPEFVELFQTAVRLYPDDPTANLNAAAAALSRGDAETAKGHLVKIVSESPVSESAEYSNAMGVLLMLNGDYDSAQACLERAAGMGLEQARQNLAELTKKRENVRAVESGLLIERLK